MILDWNAWFANFVSNDTKVVFRGAELQWIILERPDINKMFSAYDRQFLKSQMNGGLMYGINLHWSEC